MMAIRITEEDLKIIKRNIRRISSAGPVTEDDEIIAKAKQVKERMNKTERRYLNERITPNVFSGSILRWEFEAIKFRIGDNCFYTPDFFIVMLGGSIEIHEIKGGHIRDDAIVKFKAAAERYGFFKWVMIQYRRSEWVTLTSL